MEMYIGAGAVVLLIAFMSLTVNAGIYTFHTVMKVRSPTYCKLRWEAAMRKSVKRIDVNIVLVTVLFIHQYIIMQI